VPLLTSGGLGLGLNASTIIGGKTGEGLGKKLDEWTAPAYNRAFLLRCAEITRFGRN